MTDVKTFLSGKDKGFYPFAISAVLAIIAGIINLARGGDVLTRMLPSVSVLFFIGAAVNILLCIKNIKPFEIVPFVLYFAAAATFLSTEITFISNVVFGVDGNSFDAAFILISILGIVAFISGMVACFLKVEKE